MTTCHHVQLFIGLFSSYILNAEKKCWAVDIYLNHFKSTTSRSSKQLLVLTYLLHKPFPIIPENSQPEQGQRTQMADAGTELLNGSK